jgi:hypothetical protein
MSQNLISIFYDYFPFDFADAYSANRRDRVYNAQNTLITMLITACFEDKTLQHSVNIFQAIHEKNQENIAKKQEEFKKESSKTSTPKPGRPRKSIGRIQKSKTQSISSDTSGYSQARQRLNIDYLKAVFEDSKNIDNTDNVNKWQGRRVFITDGTYLQMQDTEDIRKDYPVQPGKGYPRGLLQTITEQGTGMVYSHRLSPDKKSELEILSKMLESIPDYSILLADDLYNCFAIFALLKSRNIDIIVPGKRKRNYEVLKTLGKGDEIVRIKRSTESKWLSQTDKETVAKYEYIDLRRIEYTNPNTDKTQVLYCSITDPSIEKSSIILEYISRWEIEISIREVKTIMDINILRSKTVEMAKKELLASLIAYNYIRRTISESTENSAFSPERDIIQEFYTYDKVERIDKLGRVYKRWSPGRGGDHKSKNTKETDTFQTGSTF